MTSWAVGRAPIRRLAAGLAAAALLLGLAAMLPAAANAWPPPARPGAGWPPGRPAPWPAPLGSPRHTQVFPTRRCATSSTPAWAATAPGAGEQHLRAGAADRSAPSAWAWSWTERGCVPGTSPHRDVRREDVGDDPGGRAGAERPAGHEGAPLQELAVSLYLPGGHRSGHQPLRRPADRLHGLGRSRRRHGRHRLHDDDRFLVLPRRPGRARPGRARHGRRLRRLDHRRLPVADGANARWPNYLARRLSRPSAAARPAVVDEGISGNRVLSDSTCFGVSALARFERDALSQPGVKDVILLEGINDIGFAGEPDSGCFAPEQPGRDSRADRGRIQELIAEAHARGVKIYAARSRRSWARTAIYGGYFGTAYGEHCGSRSTRGSGPVTPSTASSTSRRSCRTL